MGAILTWSVVVEGILFFRRLRRLRGHVQQPQAGSTKLADPTDTAHEIGGPTHRSVVGSEDELQSQLNLPGGQAGLNVVKNTRAVIVVEVALLQVPVGMVG